MPSPSKALRKQLTHASQLPSASVHIYEQDRDYAGSPGAMPTRPREMRKQLSEALGDTDAPFGHGTAEKGQGDGVGTDVFVVENDGLNSSGDGWVGFGDGEEFGKEDSDDFG